MGHGIPKDVAKEAEEQGLITVAKVCKELNISRRTLGRLIRMKEIEPVLIGDIRFFKPEIVEEFKLDPESIKEDREYVLDYALDTMNNQAEHIDKLIRLAHDPAQQTIKALLDENASLRKRAQEQEKTVVEVHELYGQLLRETLLAEVEAEKERAQTKMKQDALDMVKDKLVPIILENMGSNKFIQSFSDDQIEAFIESGAATPEQVVTLKKTLIDRQKKKGAKSNEAHSTKPAPDSAQ